MASVRLEAICKQFGPQEVVRDVDLSIDNGDFVVLVGPSGCGKSTTLRMIAGLDEISSGALYIGERRVNDVPSSERNVAMVFQSYALYPHMSVRENISFGLRLRKTPRPVIDERVDEVARIVDLSGVLNKKPAQLSGGQRQRVAMARAIVRDPDVFLFDEPLSNLDAKLRVHMRAELAKLHRRLGTTMIYVTHDQVEAMTLAERIVVMDGGNIQQVGTPLHVYNNPCNAFVAGFIGSPSMSFFSVQLEAGGELLRGKGVALPVPERMKAYVGHSERPLVLGIRPEHFSESSSSPHALVGRIELLEPLGAEVYAIGEIHGQRFTARLDSRTEVCVGDDVRFAIDASSVHLFDGKSKRSVLADEPS